MDLILLLTVLFLARAAASLVRAAVARRRQSRCYLLDYVCHKPCDDRKVSTEMAGSLIMQNQRLGLPEYRFLLRVIVRSGIGEESYCPRNILERREDAPTHQDALDEMDAFFDEAIAMLFRKTGVEPRDVDVLVVNVCMLSPAPSLASRIVRRFGMREDVAAYNLSGILARNVLRTRPISVALVVSTESIAPHWYTGTDRSMMLGNCLFGCGGAAVLLTNDPSLGRRAKMALRHLVRANIAADDGAHASAMKRDDGSGRVGISLSKDLPKAAAWTLTLNLRVSSLPVPEEEQSERAETEEQDRQENKMQQKKDKATAGPTRRSKRGLIPTIKYRSPEWTR